MAESVTSGSGSGQFFPTTDAQRKILKDVRAWLSNHLSKEEYNRLVNEALKEKTAARRIYKLDSLSRKVTEDKKGNPVSRNNPTRGRPQATRQVGGQVVRGHKDYSTRGREPNKKLVRARIWDSQGNVRPTVTQVQWDMLARFDNPKPITANEIKTIQSWKTKGIGKEGQLKSQQPGSRSITTSAAPKSIKQQRFDLQRWNQFVDAGNKDQMLRQRFGQLSTSIPSHRAMLSGELDFSKARLSPDHLIARATQEALKDVEGNIQIDRQDLNRARKASTTIGQFKNAVLNILRGKISSSKEARAVSNKFLDFFNKGVLESSGIFRDTKKREGVSTRYVPTDYSKILESVNKLPLTKEVYTAKTPLIGKMGDIKMQGITREGLSTGLMNFLNRFKVGKTEGGAPIFKGDISDATRSKGKGVWRNPWKGMFGSSHSRSGVGAGAGGYWVKNPKTGRREFVIM